MPVLPTFLDPRAPSYADNRAAMLDRLAELDSALGQARAGGGDKYVTRHHARGKLLARERIELLVDRDTPFLELSPVAGWGTEYPVGASVVTGIGVVAGRPCVLIANDATVRGGTLNPYTLKRSTRALEIARANRLPVINLVEIGGTELTAQAELFLPGGALYRDLARLASAGIGTVAAVFGKATAGAALLAGLAGTTILVRDRARVFLAGPPEVRILTGQQTDEESLGGAVMHATRSGLADAVAEDERDAIRLVRDAVARLASRTRMAPQALPEPPKHDADDLLGIPPPDLRVPFDPREVLGRILDGSRFDEFKPAYGTGLCTGWGTIHGHRIGVLANARSVLLDPEAGKATQFIRSADASGTPLLFLQNTTGYAVGVEHARTGIINQAAMMINAVANSAVPHLTVNIGASYGTGNYGMCGRGFDPRFLFAWPNAKSAVLGPAELAGTRAGLAERIDEESTALHLSGLLHDDGVIDPRDTRTVLGLCLSVLPAAPVGDSPTGDRHGTVRMRGRA
ncbi:MAG TPA: carboxyl transferase domain-containing protein [Micromonosporaceae bacterium]|nr:carboxyl transferase domain-containing protein [Micromonosporaceae bacterium]